MRKAMCDASVYGEMLFVFVNEQANKYFRNGGPKVLGNRLKKYIFYKPNVGLEWQRGIQRKYVYQMAAWKS